jgi:hypothetical protein
MTTVLVSFPFFSSCCISSIFFYLKTLLNNLTLFLYIFICASFMNALEPHKKAGGVECWRDNVWEGTWKQVVVVLLETLCRRMAGRNEQNYVEISEDNLRPDLVSKKKKKTPKYKTEELIPALINLRNLYSSTSFMCSQSPLLKLQFLACHESNGFCKKSFPEISNNYVAEGTALVEFYASRNWVHTWSPI